MSRRMLDWICNGLLLILAILSYAIWVPVSPAASDRSALRSGAHAPVEEAGRSAL